MTLFACSDNPCMSDGDCSYGFYCDLTRGVCTFDCRENRDCPSNICDIRGRCVNLDGGGTSSDGGTLSVADFGYLRGGCACRIETAPSKEGIPVSSWFIVPLVLLGVVLGLAKRSRRG